MMIGIIKLKKELDMRHAKFILLVITIVVASTMAFGQPSFRRSLSTPTLMKCPGVYPVNVGVKGCFVHHNMLYSAFHTAKNYANLSVDGGLTIEWECSQNVSVGLDAIYATRGTKKSFKTEFLLNYSTSDFAYYDYSARLRGIEVFLPITFYKEVHFLEDMTSLRNSSSKVYLFVGPELYVPVNGNLDWKRYYSDGTIYSEYHLEATQTTVRVCFYGLGFGIGFWHKNYHSFALRDKNRPINTFSIVKVDFSCFLESNSLSKQEMEETVEHVYGWGDLEHETLGKRYGLVFKISGTVMFPVKHKPSNACSGIGAKNKRGSYRSKYK